MLFFSYLIGLWFTLRTHAAVIWNAEVEEKKHEEQLQASILRSSQPSAADTSGADIRDSHLYKRILGQSLKQVGLQPRPEEVGRQASAVNQDAAANGMAATLHVVPPKGGDTIRSTVNVPGLSQADNTALAREVAQIAATAATFASRDRERWRKTSATPGQHGTVRVNPAQGDEATVAAETATAHAGGHGGHDAPNWGRAKSSIVLLGATILYAVIAEILVDTVDVVLESFSIDQKFLGITLFALVPNTTEFLVSLPRNTYSTECFEADAALECHLICYERQHCSIHGDWFSLRPPGVPAANPRPRVVLGRFSKYPQRWRSQHVHIFSTVSSMGHGDGYSLRLLAQLRLRRREKQLFQGQHFGADIFCRGYWILL
jgi:Ca2+:H+ antiporter